MSNPAATHLQALDACHRQMQAHLVEMQRIAQHMQSAGLSDADRRIAGEIQDFFSHAARTHHELEETQVFAPLLARSSDEVKEVVRSLQQDHGFLEENWIELGPQLRGIAEGNDWFDVAEFLHNVALYRGLLTGHIALEESLSYPESKSMWAHAVAQRTRRY